MYSEIFKIDKKALVKKLWGDNYYDASQKKWTSSDVGSDGKKLKRAFVEFIMDPIISLTNNIMADNKEVVLKVVKRLGIHLSTEEQKLIKKDLLKNVFMKWLNAADSLLEMIVEKLPSPLVA
jgi:elongation factor 2